jgi:uncharacterized protein
LSQLELILLPLVGFITGLIDSVVGGGGLISVPTLSILLGPGALAIGTNKIVGTAGALMALLVYAKKGHLDWRRGLKFVLLVGLSSWIGSRLNPFVSKDIFKILMLVVCPVILYLVLHREVILSDFSDELKDSKKLRYGFILSAVFSGLYDGFFGPGGGTFMFFGLHVFGQIPLLQAIAISKLANSASAGASLFGYSTQGFVRWDIGLLMAAGMLVGAFIGARHTTKKSAQIVKPMLIFVVSLLMLSIAWDLLKTIWI